MTPSPSSFYGERCHGIHLYQCGYSNRCKLRGMQYNENKSNISYLKTSWAFHVCDVIIAHVSDKWGHTNKDRNGFRKPKQS